MNVVSIAVPQSADELLPLLSKESLQIMGRAWGLEQGSYSKASLIQLLTPLFADPERIDRCVRALSARERTALDHLILNGGRLSAHALRRLLESQGLIDAPPQPRGYFHSYVRPQGSLLNPDSRKLEDILAQLGVHGLAFPWPPGTGMVSIKQQGKWVVIPLPILKQLPPVALSLAKATEPEMATPGRPDALLRDLVSLIAAIRREPIQLTARGLIPKRSQVKLAEFLSSSETQPGYLPFLASLATSAGLVVSTGGRLQEGSDTAAFMRRPRGERLQRLFDAYVSDSQWSELAQIPDVTIRGATEGAYVVGARRQVINLIARCPARQWVGTDAVIDLVRRVAFEFLIPRVRYDAFGYYGDYPDNPYIDGNSRNLSFGELWEEGEGWNRIEGGFIRVMLSGPLFWFGLVDLGSSGPDSQPEVVLLNQAGAALCAGRTPVLPEPSPNIVIQPNFQIFAFEPTGEAALFTLEQIADRVSAQQAIEYRITRDSIYRAQQSGMDVGDILTFLERASTVPIPQNVRRSIEEWAAQSDRIVVRVGAPLLQTVDQSTLDGLYARDDIAPLLGRRLAPTAALVRRSDLTALNALLTETAGPMPALSEGEDTLHGGAIRVGDDGGIAFRPKLPSVHTRRALEEVADAGKDGGYQLTRGSLRRAARDLGPDDIVELLTQLQGAPLSSEVTALIRRWTRNWGSAALAEVTILQVESADILQALMEAPDLRPYLERIEGAETSALVRGGSMERVRAALEERGVDLRSSVSTTR